MPGVMVPNHDVASPWDKMVSDAVVEVMLFSLMPLGVKQMLSGISKL
jgi:hypothetical protein